MYGLHQGYLYQDLLAAFLISENIYQKDFKIGIEFKDSKDDIFDDIFIVSNREKIKFQIKHSAKNNELSAEDFTKQKSDLNINKVIKSISDKNVKYVIATNREVVVNELFIKLKNKINFFSPQCNVHKISSNIINKEPIKQLLILSSLPDASFDLSSPGDLEKKLLESLSSNVGIGYYPNNKVSVRDVASRLILLVSSLRGLKVKEIIDRDYICGNIGLNFEYGHIVQNFPFISSEYRIYRNNIVSNINDALEKHNFVVLKGAPGTGKSHLFDDIHKKLIDEKIIAVKHFCYLELTDQFSQDRILAEAMYGNFLHQLESAEPKIAENIKPYFAATKSNLENIISEINKSGKKIILMIDGLDHLSRVILQNKLSPDLVSKFISSLLDIKMPKGCAIFIASQPSDELDLVINKKKPFVYLLNNWSKELIGEFVGKHNKFLTLNKKIILKNEEIEDVVDKVGGNPLYLTYIIKDFIYNKEINFIEYIKNIPKLNNDLNNYYKYLIKNVNESDFVIIQTLALLDFSITKNELFEMFPPIQKEMIDGAIGKIQSILKPGTVNSGIRIYHESFRRFFVDFKYADKKSCDLYKHIIEWLYKKDFFVSQRSYKYLISYLIKSNRREDVYKILSKDFIVRSLYYFKPIESINNNLNKIADCSAQDERWDIYCKAVELKRSLHTYSAERYDSVDDLYNKTILNIHGAKFFCEHLIFDGKSVFQKQYGALLCKMAEFKGGNPPWDFYDVSGLKIKISTNSENNYYHNVESAHFLNISKKTSKEGVLKMLQNMIARNKIPKSFQYQISLLLEVFDYSFGVYKYFEDLQKLRISKQKKLYLNLEIAKNFYNNGHKKEASNLCDDILSSVTDLNIILQAILFGGDTSKICVSVELDKLTKEILDLKYIHDKDKPVFDMWYKSLQIVSRVNIGSLDKLKSTINIDGWYRAWILFIFNISLLEVSNKNIKKQGDELEEHLQNLLVYSHPFRGEPRAMDLYGIRNLSEDSFRRALAIARNCINYSNIVNILSQISLKSTSYLQGSSDGPLCGEIFNNLLKEEFSNVDSNKKRIILKILENNVLDNLASSVYYDSKAFDYLKLADLFFYDNKNKKSKESLTEACLCLSAYGFRKDVTIYEIIEPIQFLASKDLKFAIESFKKCYHLVEIVWRNTDGKGTKNSLVYWLKTIINSDLKLGTRTIAEMIKIDSKRDWRLENGTEYLCSILLKTKINPNIIADLYKTIQQTSNSDFDVSVGLSIVERFIENDNKKEANELFTYICKTLYLILLFDHVYEKDNFIKILKYSKKNNLFLENQYRDAFIREIKKTTEGMNVPVSKYKKTYIKLSFNEMSIEKIEEFIDKNFTSDLLNKYNARKLGTVLLKLSNKNKEEVKDIILSLVRKGFYSDDEVDGLIMIKDIFLNENVKDIAAFISALAFIYARGGNGWYSLADSKYNYLGRDAIKISKEIAKRVISSELSYLFTKSTYFAGPVRHLIEFSVSISKIEVAKKIWTGAYEIINNRLPAHPDLVKFITQETPSFNYNHKESLETCLKNLINIRNTITS